ncbi:hypothetical protein B5S33_g1726 [[Candida] boidinii]|nr:hypothetical protein B5S30_g259 [[Candida] boidinii]OWB83097.1 hypothetical protein B5S33_g1726 [[Candida] boidinii]GMG03077.1 unnamed protein product [[Candida] boidinii]
MFTEYINEFDQFLTSDSGSSKNDDLLFDFMQQNENTESNMNLKYFPLTSSSSYSLLDSTVASNDGSSGDKHSANFNINVNDQIYTETFGLLSPTETIKSAEYGNVDNKNYTQMQKQQQQLQLLLQQQQQQQMINQLQHQQQQYVAGLPSTPNSSYILGGQSGNYYASSNSNGFPVTSNSTTGANSTNILGLFDFTGGSQAKNMNIFSSGNNNNLIDTEESSNNFTTVNNSSLVMPDYSFLQTLSTSTTKTASPVTPPTQGSRVSSICESVDTPFTSNSDNESIGSFSESPYYKDMFAKTRLNSLQNNIPEETEVDLEDEETQRLVQHQTEESLNQFEELQNDPALWSVINAGDNNNSSQSPKANNEAFKCSHCKSTFSTLPSLVHHLDKLKIVHSCKCPVKGCPYRLVGLPRRIELERHCLSQHSLKLETAEQVSKSGKGVSKTDRGSNWKYSCTHDGCGRKFKRKDSLRRHSHLVHENPNSRFNQKLRIQESLLGSHNAV